jgi:translation initiation factor IF-1
MSTKEETIEVEGEVTEALPNMMFRVRLTDGRIILCHLAGKMRIYNIKVMPGDHIRAQMTPYDLTKGRITYRMK